MATVEHWWNQKSSGMARRDVFLCHTDQRGWWVDARSWPDDTWIIECGTDGEDYARRLVQLLRDIGAEELPGCVWKDLGPPRTPRRSGRA